MRFKILKEIAGEFVPTGETLEMRDSIVDTKEAVRQKSDLFTPEEAASYLDELKGLNGASYALEAVK